MWTRIQLLTAYDMAERNMRLADIGRLVGHTAAEVDLDLWAVLITDTVQQALSHLNGSIGLGHAGSNKPRVVAK